jgi:hypothetical protein
MPVVKGDPQTLEIGEHADEIRLAPAEKFAFWKKYFEAQLATVHVN